MTEEFKSFRIIFMGTPDFAVPALRGLIAGPDEVVAVISQPDRPKGRGKKMVSTPVKLVAESAGIPVLQPTKIKTSEFADRLRSFNPDMIVVAAYGRILPLSILNLPPLGCINIHGSLLPRHRGAAPIQWAVLAGDREAGVTIMNMDEGMDTGDMLLQASIPVASDETSGGLFTKLSELGGQTLLKALDLQREGRLTAVRQDHRLATEAPPLKKEDGFIDWSRPAEELQCFIRGMDPWPTAYAFMEGQRFRFYSPVVRKASDAVDPGTVLKADRDGLLVATGEGAILIREIQPEGKKRMSVEAYLCGNPIKHGLRFTGSI